MPRDPFKAPPGQQKPKNDPQGRAVGWWYGKRKIYTGVPKKVKASPLVLTGTPKRR